MTDKISMENNSIPARFHAIGRLLTFAQRSAVNLGEKKLEAHGLTLTQWVILSALWRQDGMTNGELAKYYGAKDAALSRALDRMVTQGLIKRKPDGKDRRVVRMYLTPKSQAMSHLIDFYQTVNDLLLEDFNEDEKVQLFAMLERVIENSERRLKE
ncbi:MAG: MarR family transcriptional regulator [Rhodospirillales bacterium]|nr:MarR family transcriptional regulator [Rhodospirillales bacterium]